MILRLQHLDFAPKARFTARRVEGLKWFCQAFLLTLTLNFAFPSPGLAADRVMIYGDSLSASYGIDPKDGWVSLLQAKLAPDGVTVINSSISGETSRGGLSRIATDLARIRPTVVVLALGANDGLRGLPVVDTKKNLQAIIAQIRAAKARPVLIGIQIPPNYGPEYSKQFRELYTDLARQNKLPPPPFLLEGIAEKLELFQADRLHPKAEAQAAILENVLPTLRKVLNKSASKSITPAQHERL